MLIKLYFNLSADKRKTDLDNHTGNQQNGDAEAKSLPVRKHGKKLSAKGKSCPKNHKGQCTKECLHLESSGENQANSESALDLEEDGKSKQEASLNQTQLESNKLKRDISDKLDKHSDSLEILGMENDLVLKFQGDLDVGGENLHQTSNEKHLTKSESFPLTRYSMMRRMNTPTFRHKQTEIWAFSKGEKLLAGAQAPKMSASSFVEDISYEKQMKQKQNIYSRFSQGLNHKGWNQMVLHSFRVIKQKIKNALSEAIYHVASPEYSSTNDEKEVSEIVDAGVIRECEKTESSNEIKTSDYVSNKDEAGLIQRTSSLDGSLDKYTELFEKIFSKDANKYKCLNLINEDKVLKSGSASNLSRRNYSLPCLESLGFILHEVLRDRNIGHTLETDNRVQRKSLSSSLQTAKSLDRIEETEIVETVEGDGRDVNSGLLSGKIVDKIDEGIACDQRENIHEIAWEDGSFLNENVEISKTIYPSKEVVASFEAICEDNTTIHAEGGELNPRSSGMEESESDNHFLLHKSGTENDSNFKYVKKILEVSGFMGNEQNQMWHTLNQPIKPSLRKDLENEIESYGEEIASHYDHQLLFNLVNEVLLEIDQISPTYFPVPFSFNKKTRPMPKGNYLLNDVWTIVNSYLSLRPELDQTLDDVISRDLAKGSVWMNLQQEEEYVGLELEEMIVDDLLDELVFS
ncbi:hypothetical protein TanjilG_04280 [Lupinus angustifolius]|uniref:DUF4378 domain-containing protein n=1 Tax=Lupinus angustifolius TaxID=3871 RepID=A0A4P1RQ46_LUPAN|nr:hypothetical protein TanjilG_04280 [Lupinus angustifolius]